MSIYIHKSHNVNVLIYHLVCPTKYRRVVITDKVDKILKETCLGIALRYEMHFLEIGTDRDHVHFLIQTIPMTLPTNMVRKIKSLTSREIFDQAPEIKKQLWGGEFWSDGYYLSTVGKNGSETVIQEYVKGQGSQKEYIKLHKDQLQLF